MKGTKYLGIAVLAFFCAACNTGSKNERVAEQKDNVEDANEDKFSTRREKKDADFVVEAIDKSYAIMELARLGQDRGVSPQVKQRAREIVVEQTEIINKLKNYAEQNNISVQFSGPEKTKANVERLYDVKREDFDKKWSDAMANHNKELIDEFEDHADRADQALNQVVMSSLTSLRKHQDYLENYLAEHTDQVDTDNN